jgi:hypothetical protein
VKAPQAIGWWIKTRAVSDFTHVLNELRFDSEDDARVVFDRMREHSEKHGGSAVLLNDGCYVASFSFWSKSD